MNQSLVTVVRYEEYGNTSLLKSLTLGFDMKGSLDSSAPYYDRVQDKIDMMIRKIKFCYHDGIDITYSYDTVKIGEDMYEILLNLEYHYEKNPNYYKIDLQGLLPCVPKYDKSQFEYALYHGLEPTLNMVEIVNI